MTKSWPMLLLMCGFTAPVARAADEFFDSNGVKIRYVSEGTGEAVVLIHGWMADSSMWGKDRAGNTKLKTDGAEGFRFIAIDCRGHGKSDKLYDPAKYGPEMAADIVRLLDHLKIDKAHLVGYSMGAMIAGKVVATHPERVRSVIYGGQAPILTTGESKVDAKEIEIFAKAVDDGNGLGSYLIAMTPAGRPKPTEEQAKGLAKYLYDGKDVKAFAAAGRGFKNLDVTAEQLKKCPAPSLFIYGANEPDHLKDRVAAWRKTLGRGELIVIDNADHMFTLTRPEFGKGLIEFLKANRAK